MEKIQKKIVSNFSLLGNHLTKLIYFGMMKNKVDLKHICARDKILSCEKLANIAPFNLDQ